MPCIRKIPDEILKQLYMSRSQNSFIKGQKEKLKQKKKKEKAERKKERKENNLKGKGFEDMLAYVDENGNITSEPPEEKDDKKKSK